MKRNDFILTLKQGFNMEHALVSNTTWDQIIYEMLSKWQRKSNSWIILALGNVATKQKSGACARTNFSFKMAFIAGLGGFLRFITYTTAQVSIDCLECDILGICSK
jgi:hypothetical protein